MRKTDKVEVIVVGAGPSGLSCALTLARYGIEVLVIERGEFSGAKNMFGGIFFSNIMEKLFRVFWMTHHGNAMSQKENFRCSQEKVKLL